MNDDDENRSGNDVDIFRHSRDDEAMRRLKLVKEIKPRRSLSPRTKEWLETLLVAAAVTLTIFYAVMMVRWIVNN